MFVEGRGEGSFQLIVFLDLKYPSSFSFKTSFVNCLLVCIILLDKSSFTQKLSLGRDCKLSVGRIQTGLTDLLPSQVFGMPWPG